MFATEIVGKVTQWVYWLYCIRLLSDNIRNLCKQRNRLWSGQILVCFRRYQLRFWPRSRQTKYIGFIAKGRLPDRFWVNRVTLIIKKIQKTGRYSVTVFSSFHLPYIDRLNLPLVLTECCNNWHHTNGESLESKLWSTCFMGQVTVATVRLITNTLKEAFMEYLETKTEVINLLNHEGRRQSMKPIKT